MSDRYDTSSSSEGQYQPGSDERVLVNKLGITDPDEMDDLEFDLLIDLQEKLVDEIESGSKITMCDLYDWHHRWLFNVYEWAGKERSTNTSKDGFLFANANLIPKLMSDFDRNYLSECTPCEGMTESVLVEKLAVCHIEFILIHPFRDGNGRIARLLATIMSLQANMPPLNFEIMSAENEEYISAIHSGVSGNYEPMKLIFERVLADSYQ